MKNPKVKLTFHGEGRVKNKIKMEGMLRGDSKASELERDRGCLSMKAGPVQNKHGRGLCGQAVHFP